MLEYDLTDRSDWKATYPCNHYQNIHHKPRISACVMDCVPRLGLELKVVLWESADVHLRTKRTYYRVLGQIRDIFPEYTPQDTVNINFVFYCFSSYFKGAKWSRLFIRTQIPFWHRRQIRYRLVFLQTLSRKQSKKQGVFKPFVTNSLHCNKLVLHYRNFAYHKWISTIRCFYGVLIVHASRSYSTSSIFLLL